MRWEVSVLHKRENDTQASHFFDAVTTTAVFMLQKIFLIYLHEYNEFSYMLNIMYLKVRLHDISLITILIIYVKLGFHQIFRWISAEFLKVFFLLGILKESRGT